MRDEITREEAEAARALAEEFERQQHQRAKDIATVLADGLFLAKRKWGVYDLLPRHREVAEEASRRILRQREHQAGVCDESVCIFGPHEEGSDG